MFFQTLLQRLNSIPLTISPSLTAFSFCLFEKLFWLGIIWGNTSKKIISWDQNIN